MQARIVLLPMPDAPNKANEEPRSRFNLTSTVSSRRFLMMWALSMALTLGEHVNHPGKRQGRNEEYHKQGHYRRQAKALQIYPELHRHAGWIICSHYHRSKLTDRPDPRDAQRDRQS